MKRREIAIELTALLDVILIILFALLSQAKMQTAAGQESMEAAIAESEALRGELQSARERETELTARLEAAERRETTDTVVQENSLILTLSVRGGEERAILLEEDGCETALTLREESENYLRNKLRSALSTAVESAGKESVFIVFQYDPDAIYHREHELIDGTVRELRGELRRRGVGVCYVAMDIREEKRDQG